MAGDVESSADLQREVRHQLNLWVGAGTGVISTAGVLLSHDSPRFGVLLVLWVLSGAAGGVVGHAWRRALLSEGRLVLLSTTTLVPLSTAMIIIDGGLSSILWLLLPLGGLSTAFVPLAAAAPAVLATIIAMSIAMLVPSLQGEGIGLPIAVDVAIRCGGFVLIWVMIRNVMAAHAREATARLESERRAKDALEQLVVLQERSSQQNKMEAVGRLAGSIAHDFNNLLMVISSLTESIRGETDPDASIGSYIRELEEVTAQSVNLTQQLLDLSPGGAGDRQLLDARALILDNQSLLARSLGKEATLDVVVPDEPIWVRGIRVDLLRVFVNLAVNARDALGEGGRLTVTIASTTADAEEADVVEFRFEDDGEGMSEAVRSRALEPYFTTRSDGSGSGIGLSSAYSCIVNHGGSLELLSTPGVGTTVRVMLPRVAAPAHTESSSGQAPTTANAGTPTQPSPGPRPSPHERGAPPDQGSGVVVVDDDPRVRRSIVRYLKGTGHRVIDYENPLEFLAEARDGLSYDALITDIRMPQMSGINLVHALESAELLRPTVFVSGFSEEPLDLETFECRSYAFIPKPFDRKTLLSTLEACLARFEAEA